MNNNPDDNKTENYHTDHIEVKVTVCTNYVGITRKDAAEKSLCASHFIQLVFVKGCHQNRVI